MLYRRSRELTFVGPIAVGLIVALVSAPAIRAQSTNATTPKFDAVSIKPCAPGDGGGRGGVGAPGEGPAPGLGGSFSRSPGRFRASCASLITLINVSYVTNGSEPLINDSAGPKKTLERVRGVPAWAISARYTIEAVTDDPVANGPTEGQSPAGKLLFGAMLQALLVDRFQLKFHRETEELPMYALTVAKGGLRLQASKDGDCVTIDKANPPRGFPALTDKPYCHTVMGYGRMGDNPNEVTVFTGQSLSALANSLSGSLDRHVIDQTGIAGPFNFRLEFSLDENALAPDRGAASDIPGGQSVFAALEKMGLKLEAMKGPRGYIVVDSVSPPSEN